MQKPTLCFIKKKNRKSEKEKREKMIQCVKEIYAKITPEVVVQSWKQVGLEYPVDQLNIVPEKTQ